jgi:pimeloyl-ACP methyl ester carboxylesterase
MTENTSQQSSQTNKDGLGHYADIHGLSMYYEIHGEGFPLVLLHGGISAIGTSFGKVLPDLARGRKIIGVEQQGHGHTADIDRPLTYEGMANDTIALLSHLGIEQADFYGYSVGAGVATQIAIVRPSLVRKLVLQSFSITLDGLQPGFMESMDAMKVENTLGSPFAEEYARIAPHPQDWATVFNKTRQLDLDFAGWPPEAFAAIQAPTLILMGDADIIRPEHGVEMLRLLGGGENFFTAGPSRAHLAILPNTNHVSIADHSEWLVSMITQFLDALAP